MISECLVVEFQVTGDECPLADATRATGGTVEASPPLLREDGYTLLRFSTDESRVGDVLDADDRIRYLHRAAADGRDTYRCLSKERCVVHRLIDEGFLVETVRYVDGVERHLGAVVGQEVLHGVLEAAGEAVGVQLERISPLGEEADDGISTRWNLTPAQAEALRTAHRLGYFDVPKGATAQEVADAVGISKSAFLERLRRAQSELFDRLLN
ncbi:helix-turn-helix domain-containing protein [Natronomonas halophila]|uniref:helix-turn-helix domain-containing protein n=1 Tax=Natronomonas halophila TaxID=2747817 RepID=UPI0015B3EE6E|nr:helix-turn-helix domain-containing protein [Natronomonas halophila]QLD84508.1 helix-turn-helix domain-containing protein [Natronomonas halophila]